LNYISTEDDSALSDLYIQAIPQTALVTATIIIYTYTAASRYTYTIGGLLPDAYLVQVISSRYFEYYNDVTVGRYYYANDVPVLYTTTDAAGRYAFGNLSAGSYFVSFVDPTGAYAVAYNNDARTFEAANSATFDLDDNEVIANVNAALEAGGAISGRILDLLSKGAT
jgi:hypothetical protein